MSGAKWLEPTGVEAQTELFGESPRYYRCTVAGTVYDLHVLPYYPGNKIPGTEIKLLKCNDFFPTIQHKKVLKFKGV